MRSNDDKFLKQVFKNKDKQEIKKDLTQKNRQLVDDLERMVRLILNCKSHAMFVQCALLTPEEF